MGFVSNSSSSSYLIYGTDIPDDILKDLARKEAQKHNTCPSIHYAFSGLRILFQGTRISIEGFIEKDCTSINDYWSIFVGGDPRSMREDETMGDFKTEIQEVVQEKLQDYQERLQDDSLSFDWYEDSW